jgi:hypothetical protein
MQGKQTFLRITNHVRLFSANSMVSKNAGNMGSEKTRRGRGATARASKVYRRRDETYCGRCLRHLLGLEMHLLLLEIDEGARDATHRANTPHHLYLLEKVHFTSFELCPKSNFSLRTLKPGNPSPSTLKTVHFTALPG